MMKGPIMPSTKLLVSTLVAVTGNIIAALAANTGVWDPIPDPWRPIVITLIAYAAGWWVRARHLAPSELDLARQIGG
jgi:hypothetical protein